MTRIRFYSTKLGIAKELNTNIGEVVLFQILYDLTAWWFDFMQIVFRFFVNKCFFLLGMKIVVNKTGARAY